MKYFILFYTVLLFSSQSLAQISFEDQTEEYGFTYRGRSYGSSWGDMNGDGWYDIFMSCHYHVSEPYFTNDFPKLFLNLSGDSLSFTDFEFDTNGISDLHGAVFFDYDNDGDEDLLVTSGGLWPNLFYRNDGQTLFTDSSVEENIHLMGARGRQTTCFDFNNDGLTDLLFNNEEPGENQLEAQVRVKNFGAGYNLGNQFGWQEDHSEATQITDLNSDGIIDLLITQRNAIKVLSRGTQEDFEEVYNFPAVNVQDVECADFNNDLLPDIFIARSSNIATSIGLFNENAIHSSHRMPQVGSQSGYSFQTTGSILLKILPSSNFNYVVHLGSDFVSPELNWADTIPIELSADTSIAQGWQEPDPDLPGVHVYVGQVSDNNWSVEIVSLGTNGRITTDLVTSEPIQNFETAGVPEPEDDIANILLINQGDFSFIQSEQPALEALDYTRSLARGDYDNDGDIDLYSVVSWSSVNLPNLVYENDGEGNFESIEDGWNTSGTGPGIGEAVTTGDLNNDGLLDLFVTNGASWQLLDSARHVLFMNETQNTNNWTKIKLIGDISNSNGFGAKVFLTADGSTQLREMTGGIHGRCQDDPRLHFGLGSAELIESLQVQWPSGLVDEYTDLPVNQILTLTEGNSPISADDLEKFNISVFPNPSVNGELIVTSSQDEPLQLRLFDAVGNLLHSAYFSSEAFRGNFSYLASGVYFVRVSYLNNFEVATQTFKWVKN